MVPLPSVNPVPEEQIPALPAVWPLRTSPLPSVPAPPSSLTSFWNILPSGGSFFCFQICAFTVLSVP